MSINYCRVSWFLHRLRHRRRPTIEEIADSTWQLCEAKEERIPPAIYLDGALEQIRAFSPWTTRDYEMPRILGGMIEHAASKAHLLRSATVFGAYIYKGAYKNKHGYGTEVLSDSSTERFRNLISASLVSNIAGSEFFGNFLLDELPLALIPTDDNIPFATRTKYYGHEAGYRELLSLPKPEEISNARVRSLTVYTDFAQNSYKRERYVELRRRLATNFEHHGKPNGRRIYLKRGSTGEPRILTNEAQLEVLLDRLGYDIVEPEKLTATEISERVFGASLVVSVEGSHISHAIYSMSEDAAILVIQPPYRFATPYKEFTDCMGMRFGFVVGLPETGGFSVNMNDLQRLADRLS